MNCRFGEIPPGTATIRPSPLSSCNYHLTFTILSRYNFVIFTELLLNQTRQESRFVSTIIHLGNVNETVKTWKSKFIYRVYGLAVNEESGHRSTKGVWHGSHQVWIGIGISFFVRDPGTFHCLLQDKRKDPGKETKVRKKLNYKNETE